MSEYLGLYNYWVVIFLMMTGFYIVIARSNLIQKVIGLNIFQISVFLLYITMGKVTGGTAPILPYHGHGDSHATAELHAPAETATAIVASETDSKAHADVDHDENHDDSHPKVVYTHPLPSVLMLTAIVVGVATTALALALVIRIGEAYGTIEEDEILQLDRETS